MQFKAAGRCIHPDEVGHTQIGFGQSISVPSFELEIHLSTQEITRLLEAPYSEYVRETRNMWEDDDDEDDLLLQAGHPPFSNVIKNQELLWFVVRECLIFSLLEQIAAGPNKEVEIYDVVSLKTIGDDVVLFCRAFNIHRFDSNGVAW